MPAPFDTFDIDSDRLLDAAPVPPLESDALHVWRLPLESDARTVARLWAVLAEDERRRAQRLRRAHDRSAFVLARGALRLLIGAYLGRAPAAIDLAYGARGKPVLAPWRVPLQFNLSHASGLCVLAFSRRRALGVDVEAVDRRLRVLPLARRILTPAEQTEFARLAPAHRARSLLELWTCKEAYLKATGEGLGGGMHSVTVSLHPGRPARFKETDPAAQSWSLWPLDLGPGHVGALVAAAPAPAIRAASA